MLCLWSTLNRGIVCLYIYLVSTVVMVVDSINLGGHCKATDSKFGGKVVRDQQETGVLLL